MSLVERALQKLQNAAKEENAIKDQRPFLRPAMRGTKKQESGSHSPEMAPRRTVTFDVARLRASGLLPPPDQDHEIGHQYRRVKRPLVAAAMGREAKKFPNGHAVMVASALSGEGKTFTCINLALSLTLEKDIHVLLIDADVAKRHISRELGIGDEVGLLDVLRDPELDVESAILPTDIPGLSVLSAGARSDDAHELVASARTHEIIHGLGISDQARILVMDSPPLLMTTEAPLLAQIAGQVVVVVRAGVTPQRVVNDALSHIHEGPSVSLVLNQVFAAPTAGYDYYYAPGKGHDAESG